MTSITGEQGYSGIKMLYQFANGLIGEQYLKTPKTSNKI